MLLRGKNIRKYNRPTILSYRDTVDIYANSYFYENN